MLLFILFTSIYDIRIQCYGSKFWESFSAFKCMILKVNDGSFGLQRLICYTTSGTAYCFQSNLNSILKNAIKIPLHN